MHSIFISLQNYVLLLPVLSALMGGGFPGI